MLPDFCLRLALGMLAMLLLLSPGRTARPTPERKPLANANFFRTQFLVVLGLVVGALLWLWSNATWNVLVLLIVASLLAFLGSVSWSLERSPGGVTLILATALALSCEMVWWNNQGLVGAFSSAALLGAAISAMLMGHNYLVSPSMSLTPLYRLLAALALALVVRMAVDGLALRSWASANSWANLQGDALLWLPVRWLIGLLGPAVLCWLAWLTARIRSTQSATGILYVVVIFCFLGELTGQLLRSSGLTW